MLEDKDESDESEDTLNMKGAAPDDTEEVEAPVPLPHSEIECDDTDGDRLRLLSTERTQARCSSDLEPEMTETVSGAPARDLRLLRAASQTHLGSAGACTSSDEAAGALPRFDGTSDAGIETLARSKCKNRNIKKAPTVEMHIELPAWCPASVLDLGGRHTAKRDRFNDVRGGGPFV